MPHHHIPTAEWQALQARAVAVDLILFTTDNGATYKLRDSYGWIIAEVAALDAAVTVITGREECQAREAARIPHPVLTRILHEQFDIRIDTVDPTESVSFLHADPANLDVLGITMDEYRAVAVAIGHHVACDAVDASTMLDLIALTIAAMGATA